MLTTAAISLYTSKRNADKQERASKKAQAEREKQIQEQLTDETNDRRRKARKERARLRAASAESGLGGVTLNTLLNDVDFQAGTDVANLAKNAGNATRNSRTQLQSTLNQIEQPDYAGAVANAGLTIYRQDQAGAFDKGGGG